MKRFIEGGSRTQSTLLPECLDDYIAETNPVRVVDVFVAVFISMLLIFLHNPIDGHTLKYDIYGKGPLQKMREDCAYALDKITPGISSEEYERLTNFVAKTDCYRNDTLPFDEWTSNSPLVYWLGSIVHLLWAIFATWITAAAWIMLMREPLAYSGQ